MGVFLDVYKYPYITQSCFLYIGAGSFELWLNMINYIIT